MSALRSDASDDKSESSGAVPASGRRGIRGAFYGWWILAASALINGIGGSVHYQGFTVLFLPVSNTLGLSHAQTALAFSLSRAENGILGPITGWLIDKFGPRPLMLAGTILVGIGYILLSRTDSYRDFVLVYIFVISLGASTSFMQGTTSALNAWFVRKRGIVMSINSAGFRLGGAFMVPVLSVLVLRYGWQTAALWIGVIMLVLITPLALFMRRSPEEYGARPDGDSTDLRVATASGRKAIYTDEDWTVKEAVKTRAFYVLAAGTVLRISVHGAIFVHIIPILVWKGQSPQGAANMVGLLALMAVPLIIFTGWLSDKVGRQKILAVAYLFSGSSLIVMNFVEGTIPIFLALLLFLGSEVGSALNWALVGDLFGRKRFATIRGMLAPMYNAALFVTPVGAGWIFDETGSYQIVLLTGGVLFFLAAIVFFHLRAPVREILDKAADDRAADEATKNAVSTGPVSTRPATPGEEK
ncbi:MAG: MFS transporter [Chloroflexi bacterium]|nr:MFS transporter [Chloroflexota bacterium]